MQIISFDFETTGFNPATNEVIEIGAVKFDLETNTLIDTFQMFLKPHVLPENKIYEMTNIKKEWLENGEDPKKAFSEFKKFIEGFTLVAHNSMFDASFLICEFKKSDIAIPNNEVLDSLEMIKYYGGLMENHKLGTAIKHFKLEEREFHRALDDAMAVKDLLHFFFKNKNRSFQQIKSASAPTTLQNIKKYNQQIPMSAARFFNQKDFIQIECNDGKKIELKKCRPILIFLDKNKVQNVLAEEINGQYFTFYFSSGIKVK